MPKPVTTWHGWEWTGRVDEATPSGALLSDLTRLMATDLDLKQTGLVVFGSAPLEFAANLGVMSAGIDVTPDQFIDHLRSRLREWGKDRGTPYVQVLPSTVFRPGRNYHMRAARMKLNGIDLILPHPIDILFAKLHRLEEKDVRAVDAVVERYGRPTHHDIASYLDENPDIFDCDSGSRDRLIANIEILWSYLAPKGIPYLDVRSHYENAISEQEKQTRGEGEGNRKKAEKLLKEMNQNIKEMESGETGMDIG